MIDNYRHKGLRKKLIVTIRQKGITDERILTAIGKIPRHFFLDRAFEDWAYKDAAFPIGNEQTISQPYTVAYQTELLQIKAKDRVLEIGTGSGHQAAVLAKLVKHVYTIEIIEGLANEATARLQRLGYNNVTTRLGDGYYGWQEHAPFDAIVVTASANHVPPPLVQQLRPGGRMVIPVGGRFMTQQLLLLEKTENNEIITRQMGSVRFVPLTRGR